MATKSEILAHIRRVRNVVCCAQLKRSLRSVDPNPTLNFWRLIYGNLLDVAVLEWCKIFGTDTEPTHWKKVVADHDAFRSALLTALKIDQASWAAYREKMKSYRDTQIAHQSDDYRVTHYPILDVALESCYFYYSYLIRELRRLGETNLPDDLRDYSVRFAAQAKEIAEIALASTGKIKERVC
jgi:hypothetical protein